MSYSICLKCKNMVSSFQKYCRECETTYQQSSYFWENNNSYDFFHDEEKRNKELCQDLKMFGGRKG